MSGDLEILEITGDDIHIWSSIHFILNMLALSFTLRCSQTTVFGEQGVLPHKKLFS